MSEKTTPADPILCSMPAASDVEIAKGAQVFLVPGTAFVVPFEWFENKYKIEKWPERTLLGITLGFAEQSKAIGSMEVLVRFEGWAEILIVAGRERN